MVRTVISSWLTWVGLFAVAAVVAALETARRASTAFFYMDDFIGIQRDGGWLDYVFQPYGGHIVFTATLVWDGWLALFGTSSYLPYLWLAIGLTTLSAVAVLAVVTRLLGVAVGCLAGVWTLFLGPAFHNQLWDQASLSLIALVALLCIALLGLEGPLRGWIALAAAVVGLGVGGLGVGVAVAFVALALIERRWVIASAAMLITGLVVLEARRSLVPTEGIEQSFITSLARIPLYVALALQEVLRASFSLPQNMAGAAAAVAVALIVLGAVAAYRSPSSVARRAFILTLTYLFTSWALTAMVRGLPAEPEGAAAPRYLGVTGPALVIALLAALVLILGSSTRSRVGRPLFHRRRVALAAGATFAVAAFANLGIWVQARANTAHLGATNMARLAAMHAGRSWIDPEFAPPGEGLVYVRQGSIEDAWARRGLPDLDARKVFLHGPSPAVQDAFLDTALEAGLLTIRSGPPRINRPCGASVNVPAGRVVTIAYSRATQSANVSLPGASQHPVLLTAQAGIIMMKPLRGSHSLLITLRGGCLTRIK